MKFISRGSGYSLFLTDREAVLALTHRDPKGGAGPQRSTPQTAVLRMQLIGAQSSPEITGQDLLPGKVNYFIGNDPAKWRTDVATYAKVRYGQVYPGIDLVYYGNQRQLEYDFVVAPGADPTRIRLGFTGAQAVQVDAHGGLVVQTAGGTVRWDRPVVYQEVHGQRRSVEGTFVLQRDHQVSFRVAAYDPTKPLVIDPTLVYSTYLGGSGDDSGAGIAVDSAGNAYVAGETSSSDFPGTTGGTAGGIDIFVTKLDATGSTIIYSTYLGGSGDEGRGAIAVDSAGNVYVAGQTASGDFPTTVDVFQTSFAGARDAFVTKLNAEGNALIFSTYLGGWDFDDATSIAVDSSGNVYVAGQTAGIYSNFPVYNGYQLSRSFYYDAFVTKLNADGTALLYSTILGGFGDTYGAQGVAADNTGNVYVTGPTSASNFPTTASAFQTSHGVGLDAFVTKLNTNQSGAQSLAYSTFLGGSADDVAYGIAVDGSGNVYVTGYTNSPDFPTTVNALQPGSGGGQDAFVAKLDTNASGAASLVYSTYLGGSGNDSGYGIAMDNTGNAYVTGVTTSSEDFPTTANAFQASYGGGAADAFATKLSADGSALLYSTYLGGSGADAAWRIAVDDSGNAYVVGYYTTSTDFPTTAGTLQSEHGGGTNDTFVTKIDTREQQAALTVSAPVSLTYGDTATLTASGGSGTGAVTFSAGTSTGCAISGADLSVTNASGTCEVTASQAGDNNYAPTTSAAATVTLQRASQTISVSPAAPASASYNASFGVAATASSALGVAVTTTGGCSGGGTGSATVTMTSGMTACVVHYNQAGNGNFNAATEVTSTTTAQKASQAITVTQSGPASATFNTSFNVTATASSSLGVAITTTGACSGSGTGSATVTMTSGAGTCSVTYNQAGNTNYSAATQVTETTGALQATQTITFGPLPNVKLSQSPVTVSGTASSDLTVTFGTTTPVVCTAGGTNGATITLRATGTCTVVAQQPGNINYLAAANVPQSFTVGNGKADQTITVAPLADRTTDQSPLTVSGTASSGLPVTFSSTTSAVCTSGGKNGTMIALLAAGTCTVLASQGGNASYNPAPSVPTSFAVTKANQSITFAPLANKRLNQSPVTVSATASSGLTVTFTTTTPVVCTSSGKNGATIKLISVGTCTVQAAQAGNAIYNPAVPATQSFGVTP